MSWTRTCRADDIEAGVCRSFSIEDEAVLICHLTDGAFAAVADSCSHDGAGLSGGAVEGAVIECPRHGARFDLRSGKALSMPAAAPIETFPVRVSEDGWIEVDVEV